MGLERGGLWNCGATAEETTSHFGSRGLSAPHCVSGLFTSGAGRKYSGTLALHTTRRVPGMDHLPSHSIA